MSITDILKNVSGASVNPLNSVSNAATGIQQTVDKQGQKISQTADTVATVAEAYAGVQLLISLASLGIAFGMLEMYKKTHALQVRRFRTGKKKK